MRKLVQLCFVSLCFLLLVALPVLGQQTSGSISGTVLDSSGAVVHQATVKIHNLGTGLEKTVATKVDGSFTFSDLPIGTYSVTFSRDGFKSEVHSEIVVQSDRTTTVNGSLQPGEVNVTVTVSGTPLMNQTDTTTGYVVDTQTIQETPLGTGSFTQLAILSPGVHADFLGGAGSNSGLGNQAIFANGNRDTSNSFSLNGTSTNNLFNGNSTSQVGENRFVLNTGENFGGGGAIQTSTSVYGAIGQALPTPPPDAISEITVNASMYDATQGNNSGAHIDVVTKSGTNNLHGSAWEQWQNSDMNAAPFFYNAAGPNPITGKPLLPRPFLNRNSYGATVGGPIKKDKLFFFGSYQGVRIADAGPSTKQITVPLNLTDDRSSQGITNAINMSYCNVSKPPAGCPTFFQASQINSASMALLNAKLPNGSFLIPSAVFNETQALKLGYDAIIQGPNTESSVDQGIAAIDYQFNSKDRLSGKYYFQRDPTKDPFGAVGDLLGFGQQLSAGSQVVSLSNTTILTPNLTWEQHAGFTRLRAYAATTQGFTASSVGISLPGNATFPQFDISKADPNVSKGLEFGPSTSFGNGGMFQNQSELGSSVSWTHGKHLISVGSVWNHTQLNVINNNLNTDTADFQTFLTFVEGTLHGGDEFVGNANRYYRSDTVGTYINDNFKLRSNLTITAGLRWDIDGPLSEKNGRLTAFNPAKYSYSQCLVGGVQGDPGTQTCDPGSDLITNSGLEVAGNNKVAGTPGASDSLMQNHQWGFAPRLGVAWSPRSNLTVRAGYGIYYDRGELFSYLSPSAGAGFNGPFGVTLAPPFVQPISIAKNASLSEPFGTTLPPPPNVSPANILAYFPSLQQTACGFAPNCFPQGNLFGPLLFGGYDIHNKLPYTQNWTLDLQYQAFGSWMFEVGYVGNHGTHLVLPIPFNQPSIATSSNVVNGQTTSYGGTTPLFLNSEPVSTSEFSGNAPLRVPFPGYDMNSVLYQAEGISNFDALQVQVHKRLSHGFLLTSSYTWSHSLDEQSGLGLFFTGNNPLTPRANYASSDFDQTHVFLINYSYTIPTLTSNKALGYAVNGWVIGGQTVAESGQPYSVYDFTGSVGSLYFGTDDEIGNPIVPLAPGVTAAQAKLQGTLGVNVNNPVLNYKDFAPQFVAPGTNGVPLCDSPGVCDEFESLYGNTGRNIFRGPFQVRFDMSLAKEFPIRDRFRLRFEFDAFNMFNHPDFDAPNNDVSFFPDFEGPVANPPAGSLGMIQNTIGSPRFLQLSLHLTF